MSDTLTSGQIFDIRDLMAEFARNIDNFRTTNSTRISASVYAELEDWSRQIKDRVFSLTGKAIKHLISDLAKPADKIKIVIGKLEAALKSISTFNNALNDIADVINVFGIIVRAVSFGLASVNIESAFSSLNRLIP